MDFDLAARPSPGTTDQKRNFSFHRLFIAVFRSTWPMWPWSLSRRRFRLKFSAAPARLKNMGRFASTVAFLLATGSRIRQSSSSKVPADRLGRQRNLARRWLRPRAACHRLRPICRTLHGLDPEAAMIAAARAAAAETGVELSLIHGRIEEFPTNQTYDVITIGRALI